MSWCFEYDGLGHERTCNAPDQDHVKLHGSSGIEGECKIYIENVTKYDAGDWTCKLFNPNDIAESASEVIRVHVRH